MSARNAKRGTVHKPKELTVSRTTQTRNPVVTVRGTGCREAEITGVTVVQKIHLHVRPLPFVSPAHTESPELRYFFCKRPGHFHAPITTEAPLPRPPLWSVCVRLRNTRAGSVCWMRFFFLPPTPRALEHGSNQTMNLREAERVRSGAVSVGQPGRAGFDRERQARRLQKRTEQPAESVVGSSFLKGGGSSSRYNFVYLEICPYNVLSYMFMNMLIFKKCKTCYTKSSLTCGIF